MISLIVASVAYGSFKNSDRLIDYTTERKCFSYSGVNPHNSLAKFLMLSVESRSVGYFMFSFSYG